MSPPTLYIWPGNARLVSTQPESLAAFLYLQLTIPDQFTVVASADPAVVPMLQHGSKKIHSLTSVIHHLRGGEFNVDLDSHLGTAEASKSVAWTAHIRANVADLTNFALYSLSKNWTSHTFPSLVALYPPPQRYYVPLRIRETHRARLEVSRLWDLHSDIEEDKKRNPFGLGGEKEKKTAKDIKIESAKAFGREKALEQARSTYDLYDRLLGSEEYFFSNRPTSLDIYFAAYLLPLLDTFSDPIITDLLQNSYPSLASHATRIYQQAVPETTSIKVDRQAWDAWTLLPTW